MPDFRQAAREVEELAQRLERPEPALARAADRCAEAVREGIDRRGLVESGELRDSVYARGSSFGVSAPYASFVNEKEPFVPVEGDRLVEPLATEVREILESHVRGDR